MNEQALKLFLDNYDNKGMCEKLPTFKKTFEKKFKDGAKTIDFYPWAVIERLFRMQGGKVEVSEWVSKVVIEYSDYEVNAMDGTAVLVSKTSNALFIHLKAEWQGEVLDEMYPIFDNQNAKIIRTPDALDLNTAKQRGSVRLIGRLSGIGLHIFEQQEEQFDDDGKVIEKIGGKVNVKDKKDTIDDDAKTKQEPEVKRETKKEKDKKVQEAALKEVVENTVQEGPAPETPIIVAQEQPSNDNEKITPSLMSSFLSGAVIEEKKPETNILNSKTEKEEEYENGSEQHADVLMKVREQMRKNGTQSIAKEFYKQKGRELLSSLSYSELLELLPKL